MEGIQQALVEVLLLANCPVLIGTYYSSYSETAKLMGWPYYIQVSSCNNHDHSTAAWLYARRLQNTIVPGTLMCCSLDHTPLHCICDRLESNLSSDHDAL